VQLGDDYDFAQHPVDVISGGTVGTTGLPSALNRLEFLWIKDMFTALQILRLNGSRHEPRSRGPYNWMLAAVNSAAPRSKLVLKAISNPATVAEADFTGIPDDQVREVKAFIGLRSWDDAVAGLPRKGAPGAGALTEAQKDQAEYIRRRRDMVTELTAATRVAAGYQYGGQPGRDPTPTGAAAGSLQAEIWAELGTTEGSTSAVNTWDDQQLTWGRGFSAKSTLPAIVDAFFSADPAAKVELMEAGFTHKDGHWLFVDLTDGQVLTDNPALSAIQTNKKFVSLLAHLADDPAHRQQFADQQWKAVEAPGHAGAVPAAIQGAWPGTWSTEAIRFGAHCVHWGQPWSQVQAHGPALSALLAWIAKVKGTENSGAILVPALASQTMLGFANGAARRLVTGPVPLPSPLVRGTFYFRIRNSTDMWAWTP
jgi:hypothetical protein